MHDYLSPYTDRQRQRHPFHILHRDPDGEGPEGQSRVAPRGPVSWEEQLVGQRGPESAAGGRVASRHPFRPDQFIAKVGFQTGRRVGKPAGRQVYECSEMSSRAAACVAGLQAD